MPVVIEVPVWDLALVLVTVLVDLVVVAPVSNILEYNRYKFYYASLRRNAFHLGLVSFM